MCRNGKILVDVSCKDCPKKCKKIVKGYERIVKGV
jgi:hypothetical protein